MLHISVLICNNQFSDKLENTLFEARLEEKGLWKPEFCYSVTVL